MVQSLSRPSAERYDTIVAGAGPAGIMAAREAAARGTVLLVETARLPRNKSCGGMLHEWTQEFLAPFGPLPEDIILSPALRPLPLSRLGPRHPQAHGASASSTSTVPASTGGCSSTLPDAVELVEACALEAFDQDDARGTRRPANGRRPAHRVAARTSSAPTAPARSCAARSASARSPRT